MLGVSRVPWLEHVAFDDMKIESTKIGTSVEPYTREAHQKRPGIASYVVSDIS